MESDGSGRHSLVVMCGKMKPPRQGRQARSSHGSARRSGSGRDQKLERHSAGDTASGSLRGSRRTFFAASARSEICVKSTLCCAVPRSGQRKRRRSLPARGGAVAIRPDSSGRSCVFSIVINLSQSWGFSEENHFDLDFFGTDGVAQGLGEDSAVSKIVPILYEDTLLSRRQR